MSNLKMTNIFENINADYTRILAQKRNAQSDSQQLHTSSQEYRISCIQILKIAFQSLSVFTSVEIVAELKKLSGFFDILSKFDVHRVINYQSYSCGISIQDLKKAKAVISKSKICNYNLFRVLTLYCLERRLIKIGGAVAGSIYAGYLAFSEELRLSYKVQVSFPANIAASEGQRDYAEHLRAEGACSSLIAQGAVCGGELNYAEYLRTVHGAEAIKIAFMAACQGYHQYLLNDLIKYVDKDRMDIVAVGAIQGGAIELSEHLRLLYKFDPLLLVDRANSLGLQNYSIFLKHIVRKKQSMLTRVGSFFIDGYENDQFCDKYNENLVYKNLC